MRQTYKNIPVTPEVYERVSQTAKANYRSMGHQVAAWAADCPHPVAMRNRLGSTQVIYPDTKVVQDVQIWQCQACGHLIILPADPFDADQRTLAATLVTAEE